MASRVVGIDETLSFIIAWLLISFNLGFRYIIAGNLYLVLVIAGASALGFLPHELSHRYMARRLGCYSRFVLDPFGLFLTLVTSFMPFKIIVPGYVLITTHYYDPETRKHVEGLTAAAGPAANIVIASLALTTLVLTAPPLPLLVFLNATLFLSSWLAVFNLLPIPPLDGSKIIGWRPLLWAAMIAYAAILLYISW